jgi:hypothetical protein
MFDFHMRGYMTFNGSRIIAVQTSKWFIAYMHSNMISHMSRF